MHSSAAGDVIDDHAVAQAEAAASGTGLDDLAARFVTGHHALVALGALAQMLVIDAADVRTADGGRLHAEQHFAVARDRDGHLFQFDGAVAGKECACHCGITPFTSQRSSQVWSCFHKKTCPLIRRQLRSIPAMAAISSALNGGLDYALQIRQVVTRVDGERDWRCAALHGPLHADDRGVHAEAPGNGYDHRVFDIHCVLRRAVALRSSRRADRAVGDGCNPLGA